MATVKQKRLAQEIIKNASGEQDLNAGQMLEKVGYSKTVAKAKPGDIIESEGVQEALADLGFSEEGAKRVVQEIMYDPDNDANARLKATDQVFKVHGSYVNEKGGNSVNIIVLPTEIIEKHGITRSAENNSAGQT